MLGIFAATFRVATRTEDRPPLPSRDWVPPEWPTATWSPPPHWSRQREDDPAK